jgi:dihydrofolate reductase
MQISVYIATSLDGYIARSNGDIDWLPPINPDGEDYGYGEFIRTIDVIVMGRKSFEKVQSFNPWPYEGTPVTVLSQTLRAVPTHLTSKVSLSHASPETLSAQLASEGVKRVYVDGGQTIQAFLRAGLITDLTITSIPVLIGSGIPLFGHLSADIRLTHLQTNAFGNGLVQSSYAVQP